MKLTGRQLAIGVGIFIVLIILGFIVVFGGSAVAHFDCMDGKCLSAERLKATSDARSLLTQIIAGVVGAGALYFTWINYLRTVRDSNETQTLARESRTSENFTKAVEQLGHETVPVRVGGIFGLARLLRTAKLDGDYWLIMDILTSFVRKQSPRTESPRTGDAPEDVQAAITVIARRDYETVPPRKHDSPVDLHGTDLSGLWMANGHFEYGFFAGCYFANSDLKSASFQGSNFQGVDLTGAETSGAKFMDADLFESRITEEQKGEIDFETPP